MSDADKSILVAFAESGMNVSKTAEKTFRCRRNVYQCLDRVKHETGLDPYNLFQLAQLVGLAEIGEKEFFDNTQFLFDRQQEEIAQLKTRNSELQEELNRKRIQISGLKNKNRKLRNECDRLKKEVERYKQAVMNANKFCSRLMNGA